MKKRFEMKLVALLLVAAALLGCLTTAFAASKKQSAAKTETLVVYAADYRWRRTAGIPLWRK